MNGFLGVRNTSQPCIQTFVQSIMRFVIESKTLTHNVKKQHKEQSLASNMREANLALPDSMFTHFTWLALLTTMHLQCTLLITEWNEAHTWRASFWDLLLSGCSCILSSLCTWAVATCSSCLSCFLLSRTSFNAALISASLFFVCSNLSKANHHRRVLRKSWNLKFLPFLCVPGVVFLVSRFATSARYESIKIELGTKTNQSWFSSNDKTSHKIADWWPHAHYGFEAV